MSSHELQAAPTNGGNGGPYVTRAEFIDFVAVVRDQQRETRKAIEDSNKTLAQEIRQILTVLAQVQSMLAVGDEVMTAMNTRIRYLEERQQNCPGDGLPRRVQNLEEKDQEYETRLDKLEQFKAQVLVFAVLGSMGGGGVVSLIVWLLQKWIGG